LVSLPDKIFDPKSEIADMGFSESDVEIRAMRFMGGSLYLLDRLTSSAEFKVHYGGEFSGPWVQIGQQFNDSPSDMWTNGADVFLLVAASTAAGLECLMLPAAGAGGAAWNPCEGFPDLVKDGPNDSYSIFGKLAGDAGHLYGLFEIRGLEQEELAVWKWGASGGWSELWQGAMVRPQAWALSGDELLIGFVGSDAARNLVVLDAAGQERPLELDGLPENKDKFSGVVGLCPAQDKTYVIYQDYASTGSELWVYHGPTS
jgi:hypothetical protein